MIAENKIKDCTNAFIEGNRYWVSHPNIKANSTCVD